MDAESRCGSLCFTVTVTQLPAIPCWLVFDDGIVNGPFPAVAIVHRVSTLTVDVRLKINTWASRTTPGKTNASPTFVTDFDDLCESRGYWPSSSEEDSSDGGMEYPNEEWPRVLVAGPGFASDESPYIARKYVYFDEKEAGRVATEIVAKAATAQPDGVS